MDFGSTSEDANDVDESEILSRVLATILATGLGFTIPFGLGKVPPPVAL